MKKRDLFRKKFRDKQLSHQVDVSIIIPMYNVENLIGETVECLKNNFCKMEILLIDDGSKDNTVENAKLAVGNDKRFFILSKENSGVSSTRNLGINKAKGEYIFFCDSDDILEENAIDKLLIAAIAEKADYVYGGIKKFNKEKEWTIPVHDKTNLFTQGQRTINKNTELFLSMGPFSKLIHRSLIKGNFFPECIHCAEDQVVIFKILLNAKKIYCIGEYIYKYRERDLENNERSITQQRDIKAFAFFNDILSVIQINRNTLENSNLNNTQQKFILRAYFERVLTFDVWPLFLRVLKFDKNHSRQALELIIDLIKSVDREFLNYTPGFRYFFLRILIDNVDYIHLKNYKVYCSLVNLILSNLREETIEACRNSPTWGNRLEENKSILGKNGFCKFLLLRQKKRIFRYLNRHRDFIGKKLFFPLMKLLPINNNKIVFATSTKGKASSNFTYLLNELKRGNQNYEIKKFLGLSNELKRNLYRYYHLATAGTIFLESYYSPLYNMKLRKRTKVVQLWHACGGFKKFAFSSLGQGDANSEEFEYHAHNFYTHVITSSNDTSILYAEAFNLPLEKMHCLGSPRTDFFFHKRKMEAVNKEILEKYPELKKTKNVLYSPTFRGSPRERKNFKLPFDFKSFDKLPSEYKIIIKLHPAVDISSIKIPYHYKSRFLVLDSSEDVNKWMCFCDILITDYSSLVFEYALLDKPIILYAYDLDEYFDERGFYNPYETYAYGKIVMYKRDLTDAILNAEDDMASYTKQKEIFKQKFMSGCNGNSSKAILSYIMKGN